MLRTLAEMSILEDCDLERPIIRKAQWRLKTIKVW